MPDQDREYCPDCNKPVYFMEEHAQGPDDIPDGYCKCIFGSGDWPDPE